MEIGIERKNRSDKANDQARLGGILATFGQASLLMDDLAIPNQFCPENGTSIDRGRIRWIAKS